MNPADKVSILLVDDEPSNLLALEEVLRPLDQTLVRADSGEDALKQVLKDEFAVILLDVRMPRLDGFAVAEHMQHLEKTRDVPIIFLTATSIEESQMYRAYSAGAVDYINKPFEPDILRSKVSVFVDLHRNKQLLAQQTRELAAQLAEQRRLNEALDRFSAWVAHDLKSPLASIHTASEMAKSNVADGDDHLRFLFDIILRQAQRADELIAGLLHLAKASGTPRFEAVDVKDLVVRLAADRPAVELEAVDVPDKLFADRTSLQQALANLFDNALRYATVDGRCSISVRATREPEGWVLSVADRGPGLPPEGSDLFEPFMRGADESAGGTGLGLAIVDAVAKAHRGQAWHEPALGGGARICMLLATAPES